MDGIGSITRSTGRPRMPRVSRETQFPAPARGFPDPTRRPKYVSGPGQPWPGFVTGNTSLSEWFVFWALMKRLGPRGEVWGYQIGAGDGQAVIDFVIFDREPRLAIRVQTEYFHVATTATRQLFDHTQRDILEALGYEVIDVYEEDFIHDPTGEAVIAVVDDALAGVERPNPAAWGTSRARPV